jgi:hypothetical protein
MASLEFKQKGGMMTPDNDRTNHAEGSIPWLLLVSSILTIIVLALLFRYVYYHSSPTQRWPDVGAAATAVAALAAGSGLIFLARQARDSASAAKAAIAQVMATQKQVNSQLQNVQLQQTLWIFENLTLGQTLDARGRLAASLRTERSNKGKQIALNELGPNDRDDLFRVMRRFQLAEVLCVPSNDDPTTYIDKKMALRLIGWDIAWWYGALVGTFGDSLAKSGLRDSWESLTRLKEWALGVDKSLAKVSARAKSYVQTLQS